MLIVLITLTLGILAGLTACRYLAGQLLGGARLGTGWRLLLAAVTLTGAGLAGWSGVELARAQARVKWPQAVGAVVRSQVVGTRSILRWDTEEDKVQEESLASQAARPDRNYRPQVTCQYRVDGQVYELTSDYDVPGFGGKLNRMDVAINVIREHPAGSELPVYFNPDNPRDAYLRPGPTWDVFGRLSLGVVLLAVALGGLTASPARRET